MCEKNCSNFLISLLQGHTINTASICDLQLTLTVFIYVWQYNFWTGQVKINGKW